MRSVIALYKVYLACSETDKSKPTGNGSGFITYSSMIYFSGIWLDKSGYLITQWQENVKNRLPHSSKIGENKKSPQGW